MFDSIISSIRYIFGNKKKLKKDIKKILGFFPNNIDYYQIAFLHRSATYTDHTGKIVNNERLEYLGDAILDAVIGDFLYKKYPYEDEGFLTQTRSKIVNSENLFILAKQINLQKFIILHTKHPVSKKNIYGDAFEAFIGAVYLDKGYNKTYKFIIKKIVKKLINLKHLINTDTNYKSQIIEWGQKYQVKVEFITKLEENKSDKFLSTIIIKDEKYGEGRGISKKEAEQDAAKIALEKINETKKKNS